VLDDEIGSCGIGVRAVVARIENAANTAPQIRRMIERRGVPIRLLVSFNYVQMRSLNVSLSFKWTCQ